MVDVDPAGTALFPISLSNQAFSTARILPLLQDLSLRYSRILFLVADRLQIYNRALNAEWDADLRHLIRQFDDDQGYLEQRRTWIERLAQMLPRPLEEDRWQVIGVEDVADADCFRIFRNVMLLYYAHAEFRDDIDRLAEDHAQARNEKYALEKRILLSKGYILEEIAISIRIHVCDGVADEYYVSGQAEPILRLYASEYGVTVADLAQRDPRTSSRFFRYDESNSVSHWTEEGRL